MSRRLATVVVLVVVLAFVVVAVAPAFAATPSGLVQHSRLLKATPADGSSVDTAEEVVLAFNEEVDEQFVKVTVEGPDGAEVDGDPQVDGREVTQPLAADLPAGKHTVTYRVVSADGHPISGKVSFTTTASPSPSASPSPTPSASASTSPSSSATPSATPTVDAEPASGDGGTAPWVWVLAGIAVLAGLLALATRGRALGGPRADVEADAEADGRPAGPPNPRDDPFA